MEKLEITKPTDLKNGLNENQVSQAVKNRILKKEGTTYRSIVLQNTITFFNIVNFILAGLVLYTGSYQNMMFMITVIANMVIGLFQQIRAKQTLDKLALLHQDKVLVRRDGKEVRIPIDEIALGDLLILSAGEQIPVDGVLVSGEVQVNESMLTGESDAIDKEAGDSIYSGCFVSAGKGVMQAVRVGEHTMVHQIMAEAKRTKRFPSMLRDAIDTIIKICTILLVPAGLLLFARSYFISGYTLNDSILSVVAALVGMIPEGLVILTSIALAVSSMKLARQEVLVQELYCIETLARVDVLCLDKTGTLTTGNMKVKDIDVFEGTRKEMLQILSNLYHSLDDDNATAKSMRAWLKDIPADADSDQNFPFSSTNKCSGAVFGSITYLIGAYSFITDHEDPAVVEKIQAYASKGIRVLSLFETGKLDSLKKGNYKLIGLVLIQDELRQDAGKILNYFKEQDVSIRIISGDMPETVAAIAKEAGVSGKFADLSKVQPDQLAEIMKTCTIFGRVTPSQKAQMVKELKKQGHTVAMTGDGVNDVLALKEADCSIAMGSGTQAARSVASLVLLKDQFEALPSILLEGRRVINNIQRTASLFLVKTLFSFGIAIMSLLWLKIYPFDPVQLTLVSSLGVGIPAFVLTLEPNYERVKGNFLANVLGRAIPGGLSVILLVAAARIFTNLAGLDDAMFSTLCTWSAGMNALWVLARVCRPYTPLRRILMVTMCAAFFAACIFLPKLFVLSSLHWLEIVYLAAVGVCIPFLLAFLGHFNWPKMLEKAHFKI